jgi:regulator of sigma E protease
VAPRSIAAESGLRAKQEIISIDGSKTPTWTSVIFRIIAHVGNQDHVKMDVQNLSNKHPTIETHVLDLSNWHLDALTPDPLTSLGITPYMPDIPLIIGTIANRSPAASSSLHIGDKLVAIDKKPIKNWDTLITTVMGHPGELVTVTVERKDQMLDVPITLGYQRTLFFAKTGYLGIGPHFEWPKDFFQEIKYGPITAIHHAWQEIYDFTYFNLLLFWKMLTGKLSLQSLGGPITIFQTAGNALNSGFVSFIGFLAFLSISIGIINLVPVPGLDGGHLIIQIIEFIIRRPVPEPVLSVLYRLGFLLLLFVIIQAFVNDILRL